MTSKENILVDPGFDSNFSWERIDEFCNLFTSDDILQDFITELHHADKAYDLKRGEFYPEILRAVISLKKSVASLYNIDSSQVHPNFGSNGSIDTVLTAVKIEEVKKIDDWINSIMDIISDEAGSLEKKPVSRPHNGGVLFTSPTYFRNYNSATSKELTINRVPLTKDFEFDTQAFIKSMDENKPSIIMLVTPNNPTGLPIADNDLITVLNHLPNDTWAMIDRTLVNTSPEISTNELLHQFADKNVIILHSFSKYQGLSHLRIGVALYSNNNTARLVQPHLPLGIGLEGCIKANHIILAEGKIAASESIKNCIRENNKNLREFCNRNSGFSVTNFSGNYCLLTLPQNLNSQTLSGTLKKQGLYVMSGSDFPEPNSQVIRLHVGGSPSYISKLCSFLEHYLSE